MREGKVARLHAWLQQRVANVAACTARPTATVCQCGERSTPDPRLEKVAAERGWTVLRLQR
jgi:hypothetical protein